MADQSNEITRKLLDLMQRTGYAIVQHNGQRKFGPPGDWTGSPPLKGCEVFIGKLPREIYEDELVPLFSKVGKIYEMRLMMDFSGSNRGYAFVTYATRAEASAAVRELNGYQIRPGRHIGVVKSVDNCRLFVGSIPKNKTKEDVMEELSKRVTGIVDVILYKNSFDRRYNRGFAFVEFTSHRAAAMARRALIPGCVKLWDQEVMVDWAEPEPDIDDEQMKQVKVLYVRNFLIRTTPDTIQSVFEKAINSKVERVKKIYDYAFIHFFERAHAERALKLLQNTDIDGSCIEIKWAKPVDSELYKIQKLNRGNAKFNNTLDLSQTMLLYKQHLEKQEFAFSPREDEGIGSACAGESLCGSPTDANVHGLPASSSKENEKYALAPAKLASMCTRYMWSSPVYNYQKYVSHTGAILWVCRLELPNVGLPLLMTPQSLGPFVTRASYSFQQAQTEAAEIALHNIKILGASVMQQTPVAAPVQTVYPHIVQSVPSCVTVPYDYVNTSILQQPQPVLPVTLPSNGFNNMTNMRLF